MPETVLSLDLGSLRRVYQAGVLRPADVMAEVLARIAARGEDAVWIHRLPPNTVEEYVRALDGRDPATLPLYGVPFAVKDNIDLAGVPTTAGCPGFAYTPARTAPAVERAIAAGAIPIGKTNLDQFATGLVGTRSPYGVPANPFDAGRIPGGSSSGSAVAVACGLVSFAFGTDTAGSGRVPAAFNNVVGLKPTRGLVSTTGVVPACRTLDCVSVFALTCDDAADVLGVVSGFDDTDPFSRRAPEAAGLVGARFRFGVARDAQLEFFGNVAGEAVYRAAVERLRALGGEFVTIDLEPFLQVGLLLYEGTWVAERYAAVGAFIDEHPEAVLPVTREIIAGGARPSAAEHFAAAYRLQERKRDVERTWETVDVLVLPTAGMAFPLADVAADPLGPNKRLGRYCNFTNLLDLSAIAVPAGFESTGMPFGVTLMAPAFHEARLLEIGGRLHAAAGVPMGATSHPVPAAVPRPPAASRVQVVVCGAHMSGLSLNPQLADRGGRLIESTRTAPVYRMVALPDGRPGLERVDAGGAIEVEVWDLPTAAFGSFVAQIPPPLGIGSVRLADGREVKGFLCEAVAARNARDVTSYGGWRAYLAASRTSS